MSEQLPSVGRIVHYVLPAWMAKGGECRPAIIVKIWGAAHPWVACQLQVFMDGDGGPSNDDAPNVVWKTSVVHDPDGAPDTWHWPEQIFP